MLHFLTFSRVASVQPVHSAWYCLAHPCGTETALTCCVVLGTVAQAMACKAPVSFKNGASIDLACSSTSRRCQIELGGLESGSGPLNIVLLRCFHRHWRVKLSWAVWLVCNNIEESDTCLSKMQKPERNQGFPAKHWIVTIQSLSFTLSAVLILWRICVLVHFFMFHHVVLWF